MAVVILHARYQNRNRNQQIVKQILMHQDVRNNLVLATRILMHQNVRNNHLVKNHHPMMEIMEMEME
jgi:hypothetical protein